MSNILYKALSKKEKEKITHAQLATVRVCVFTV